MNKAYAVVYFLPDVIGFKEEALKTACRAVSEKDRIKRGGLSLSMSDITSLRETHSLCIERSGRGGVKTVVLRKTPEFFRSASSEIKKETPVVVSLCRDASKILRPYASAVFSATETVRPEEHDLVMAKAKAYAKTDPQVSAWLEELASIKKGRA